MEEDVLTINKEFAAKYSKKKQREEFFQLRDKYGDESSSSSSEEEDEDAEAVSSDVERDFLRTLSLIKKRDPSIYNDQTKFFNQAEKSNVNTKKNVATKPLYLGDYERQRLLKKGSMAGVSDSESDSEEKAAQLTYSEEQEQLRESLRTAAEEQSGGTGEGELLVLRQKTKEEKVKEEREYVQWLKGEGGELAEEMARDLGTLREYWNDPSLSTEERFLRDYILNRGYLDKDIDRIPTYEEVISSGSDTPPNDSEDEEALEEQESFERLYNFRFEEPGSELITSYPRTLASSVRREDDRRKVKRKQREERKEKEKEIRKEEIRWLRNLREKEVEERLEKLAWTAGNSVESFGLSAEDIRCDFDPNTYDSTMKRVFGDEYYEGTEEEDKPEFSDLEIEDGDEVYPWLPEGEHDDNGTEFNMDAAEQELSKSRRKRKRRVNFDPTNSDKHQLEGHLKGELFSYRKVEPNNFGLTTEEILLSDNKELNRWVSLSKAVQYLTPEEERREARKYQQKSQNWRKKKAILATYYRFSLLLLSDCIIDSNADRDDQEDDSKDHVNATKLKTKVNGMSSGHSRKKKNSTNKAKLKSSKKISDARLKSYGLH